MEFCIVTGAAHELLLVWCLVDLEAERLRVDDCQTFVSWDKCEIDISGNRLTDSITDSSLSETIYGNSI